jgi:hypothetical protein
LFSPPPKPWRKELLHLHQINRILPEFAGGSPEDVDGELLHHLLHLFLAGDQGEGHPKILHLLPQVLHEWTRPDLLQRRPTPTSGPLLVLYSSSVLPSSPPSPCHPCANSIAYSWNPYEFHHHWWPRALKVPCMPTLSLGMISIHS